MDKKLIYLTSKTGGQKMEFRSNEIMHGEDAPFYRSLFKSMGYSDHELDHRPLIGIANTWNTCVPGHFNLNQVNEL